MEPSNFNAKVGNRLYSKGLQLNKALNKLPTATHENEMMIPSSVESNKSGANYHLTKKNLAISPTNQELVGGNLTLSKFESPTNTAEFRSSIAHDNNNLDEIQLKSDVLKKAYPYKYSDEKFATLGPSPGIRESSRSGILPDEELESTVFGQSPIHHAHLNDNSKSSDEHTYFGNIKSGVDVIDSFSGTGMKLNYGSNFNTISSSAESTPHKAFKANLMSKMQSKGHKLLTGDNLQSQESILSSHEGGLSRPLKFSNIPDARINNEMDMDKANFNPMSTHDPYDFSKYGTNKGGDEILIDQNVEPIEEQSYEESRMGKSGNITPHSTDQRGSDQISSENTTPYNRTSTRENARKSSYSPYAPLENSSNSYGIPFPKYGGKENDTNMNKFDHSSNENLFDDKTTDLTGLKSYMDTKSNPLSHTVKDNSTPDISGQADDSSMLASNLYSRYQLQNMHSSQLSSSNAGYYEGTGSKLIPSSPTIEERGPESEEASNDSQLKIEQLNTSPPKDYDSKNLNLDYMSQPKTGTIGETTERYPASSSLNFVSNLESTSNYLDSVRHKRYTADDAEDDYRSHFKKFAEKRAARQIEQDEIKPSSIFKTRSFYRDQGRMNYMNKRVDDDYEMLKKLKIASVVTRQQEAAAVRIIESESK